MIFHIIPYNFVNLNREAPNLQEFPCIAVMLKTVDIALWFRIMGKQIREQLNILRYTTILNHSRGWDGKPQGSHADSRVAEISRFDIWPRLFCAVGVNFPVMCLRNLAAQYNFPNVLRVFKYFACNYQCHRSNRLGHIRHQVEITG